MPTAIVPVLVVEDDPFPRLLEVILDPNTAAERYAAFAHVIAHELPDFEGWCERVRHRAPGLYPAEVRLVSSQEELRANLRDASVVVVESLHIGREELDIAKQLKAVQKYGTITRNIDTAACAARNVKVLTLRRLANSACSEHALAMMLTLARQLHHITGLISVQQLTAAGYSPTTFDRRHVPTSGWARITDLKMLRGSTLGILGMGEIGRELALRAAAFGMRIIYYQRNRLTAAEEQKFHAQHVPLDALLSDSDWVSIHLPETPGTRNFIARAQLAKMKRGAFLINVSRARIVDRDALIEALKSGHLGGFALDTLYEEPGRADDELLKFGNVILTPHTAAQPRFNGLSDINDLIVGLSRALAS
jgi:phosphoglycerate dehydrogenase-like enzyme